LFARLFNQPDYVHAMHTIKTPRPIGLGVFIEANPTEYYYLFENQVFVFTLLFIICGIVFQLFSVFRFQDQLVPSNNLRVGFGYFRFGSKNIRQRLTLR
jgi:hypothetical protein